MSDRTPEELAQMRTEMLDHLNKAEKLAYAIFCATDVGRDRIKAHQVYENIQNATRVGQ
jgi:hypothetical protein